MSKAQRHTWLRLLISVMGIGLMTGLLLIVSARDMSLSNPSDHFTYRVLGLISTIPLILLVLLDWRWKKRGIADERDLEIERRAWGIGATATFAIVTGAVLVSLFMGPLGTVTIHDLPSLIYIAYFVFLLTSSTAALIVYRRQGA